MRTTPVSWVVYAKPINHKDPVKAVCEQAEWDALELARPGIHTLIQAGFASEGAAENAARGIPVLVPLLWPKRRS
jgi:hypothetical protein